MSIADQSPNLPEPKDVNAGAQSAEGGDLNCSSFRELVERHPDGVLVVGAEKTVLYANPAARRLLQRPSSGVGKFSLTPLVHPHDLELLTEHLSSRDGEAAKAIHRTLRFRRRAGIWDWLECTGYRTGGRIAGVLVLILRDPACRREQLELLAQLAFTDPLTGLANRTVLVQRLEHRLKQRDLAQRPAGLVTLDLDGFKQVNDTFGHAVGDELLCELGARLRKTVREADTVARMGGDEFIVLLEEVLQIGDVITCAERLQRQLASPIAVDGRQLLVSASMGLLLVNSSDATAKELLHYSDVALYRAKTLGKDRYVVFDKPVRAGVRDGLRLQGELREAVQKGELCLLYQPEVDFDSGCITGIEALLRWRHPRRGMMRPAELLPLIQQTSLWKPVRQWVCQEAFRQACTWVALGGGPALTRLTINLSAEDLRSEELDAELVRHLRDTGLPSTNVLLECPESLLLEQTELAIHRLHALRKLGVQLAIDSFGAHFSSLRLLEGLPIQMIKLDRALVDDAAAGGSLLNGICSIARDLGISVTAKCIETPEQHRAAVRARCHRGQGYLFCPPLNGAELTPLLTASAGLLLARSRQGASCLEDVSAAR